jgi:hypothetical protein
MTKSAVAAELLSRDVRSREAPQPTTQGCRGFTILDILPALKDGDSYGAAR